MLKLPLARARFARRLVSLGLPPLLALAALLLLGQWVGAASAAARPAPSLQPAVSFVVTATADSGDNNLGDGQCHDFANGGCSLRAAVQELNVGSGGSITLPAGTFTLTNNAVGDLQLQTSISLLGAGPAATIIQGNPISWTHRILRVQDGAHVIVSGLTISGGHPLGGQLGGGIDVVTSTLLLTNSVVSNNSAGSGGGIYNSGQLDVENSIIRANQAITSGGGLYSDSNDPAGPGGSLTLRGSQVLSNSAQNNAGGGIYYNDLNPALGYLLLDLSTVSGNQAVGLFSSGGGGLYQVYGRATLSGSNIETNTTSFAGGGIQIGQGALMLSGDLVRGNQAQRGAGLSSAFSRLDVLNSLFITNTATASGGGGLLSNQDIGFFTNTVFSQNLAATTGGSGGGAAVGSSALTFTLSAFTDNVAQSGAGLFAGGSGLVTQTVLISSTISGNHANAVGGGLYATSGAVALTGSDITSNTAVSVGGGINNLGHLALTNSSVRHNLAGIGNATAGGGGGIYNSGSGLLSLVDSTLSDNTATNYLGGGLLNDGTGAVVILVNATVNGNRTLGSVVGLEQPDGAGPNMSGGGLANLNGTLDLSSVTVTSNTVNGSSNGGGLYNSGIATTTTTLRNTIVALNVETSGPVPDCAGTFISQGYNLIQNTTSCPLTGTTTGNITGKDPKLKPLGSYGGPTETREPLAGSPVLDTGNPTGCRDSLGNLLSLDQRGQARPNGPRCDIGAVEGLSAQTMRVLLPLVVR